MGLIISGYGFIGGGYIFTGYGGGYIISVSGGSGYRGIAYGNIGYANGGWYGLGFNMFSTFSIK